MRILVPTAGLRPAVGTVEYLVRVAQGLGAEIVVLHVYEGAQPSPLGMAALDLIRTTAEEREISVRTRAEQGPVVQTILEVAEEEGAALIVMGFRADAPVPEWTAAKVLHATALPVVVIPHVVAS